jgi:hypothetical protein
MGLFDRSTSTTTNATENNFTDRRTVADGGSQVVGDGSRVFTQADTYVSNMLSDSGAIDAAKALGLASLGVIDRTNAATLDTASSLFDRANATVGRVLTQAGDAQARADRSLANAAELVKSAFTTASDVNTGNRTLVTTGLVIAGIVAVLAFASRRRAA